MSKKIVLILGVVVLIIIVFGLSRLFTGSDISTSPSASAPASLGKIIDPQNQAILSRYRVPTEKDKKPETSVDKLDQAWQDGKIELEDYIVLQLRAIYGDNKLPEIYQGAPDQERDQAYIFALISENWSSLSKETQEAILPFLLPATDSKSYFYPDNSVDQHKTLLQKIFDIKTAKADNIFNLVTAMDKVTVAYPSAKEAELKTRAEWVAQASRDAIAKFEPLLYITHQQIDINLVSPDIMSSYGSAGPNPLDPSFCVVKVRDNLDEKTTKSTTAHEIFHCFQFKLGLKYIKPEMKWLMEATATWSEDFVYHGYNTEHEYDGEYFGETNSDLLSLKGNREYSSYLWFYYIVQKAGFNPGDVAGMLISSKTSDPRNVLNSRPNLNYDFKDFAVWNWNQDIAKYYVDDPKFPDESIPNTFSLDSRDIKKIGEDVNNISLDKGGIIYTLYTFPNEDIKSIKFKPKEFVGSDNSRKGIQALYKVNGNWYQEDWSGLEEKTFCRKIDDENVELVVIITSNSDMKNKSTGPIKVKTEKKCNPGWRGTIVVDWGYKNSNSLSLPSRTITGNYYEKGGYTLHEALEYDEKNDSLNIVNQEYSALYESGQGVNGGGKECGLLWSQSSHVLAGSGFDDFSKEEEPESRMVGDNDANEENHKFQGKYELSFNIFSISGKNDYKFKGQDISKQFNLPCSLVGIPEPNGLEQSVDQVATNRFAYEPNGVDIEVKPSDRVITGQDKFEIHDNVFGTVRWRFQKAD